MPKVALLLIHRDSVYEDIAIKFFEHFALIAKAMENQWDEHQLRAPDRSAISVRARSIVGLLPALPR